MRPAVHLVRLQGQHVGRLGEGLLLLVLVLVLVILLLIIKILIILTVTVTVIVIVIVIVTVIVTVIVIIGPPAAQVLQRRAEVTHAVGCQGHEPGAGAVGVAPRPAL